MKRFYNNIKKYFNYSIYSAKSELKSEVADSYLNWLWWILDPVAFMIIYTFIVEVVFKSSEPNFPVFVFIGLTVWNFFNLMVSGSVKLVTSNKGIVTKIYIPKYVLLLYKSFVYLFKMFISMGLVCVLLLIYKVPLSFTIINIIPVLIVLYLVSFGISSILMHFGIFVEDLSNVTAIVLKLLFYLSGIFYSVVTRIPAPYNFYLLNFNPGAFFVHQFRLVLLYGKSPDYIGLGIWFVVGILLTSLGVKIIHKYENSYAKVI